MVSIIVCSKKHDLLVILSQNINKSIGVVHELIAIDNSDNKYSIFEAYNEGTKVAKYETLLYLHDDIRFLTEGWGNTIVDYFESIKDLGVVGVAGSKIKTKAPSGWWDSPRDKWVMHLYQKQQDGKIVLDDCGWESNEKYSEVVMLDGVLLATHKKHSLSFDEKIKGFHGYDSNICMEAFKRNLKVIVTREILLEHYSTGKANKDWLSSADYLYKKYAKYLPLGNFNSKKMDILEEENYLKFINKCIAEKALQTAILYWLRLIIKKPFLKKHFMVLKGIVYGKPFLPYA